MTSFRTEFQPSQAPITIDLHDQIVTLGSCFSDQIGKKLLSHKFTTLINPFGTVYNPISIHRCLNAVLSGYISSTRLLQRDNTWFHYDFHSNFNGDTSTELILQLTRKLEETKSFLGQAQIIMITYGTSWVYEHLQDRTIVANCHKIPSNHFQKRLLSLQEIISSFQDLLKVLLSFRPGIQIILTVSPVRHIKDTLALNAVSKSLLRVACHQLATEHQNIHYFPAYEILIDDLRDYRFYDRDLIHPNEVAVDYIWQKFADTYFTSNTKDFIKTWEPIKNALHHRPMQPGSESHQKFLYQTLKQLQNLSSIVDVRKEIQVIQSQLTSSNANK